MIFSSIVFLFIFLPLVLLSYYAAPKKARNIVLLIFSLIFYAWGEPVYIFLMIYTIVMNYCFGLALEKAQAQGKSGIGLLIISIILNLALLGYFKYAGFIAGIIKNTIPPLQSISTPEVSLPIGISFYIFQSMSYTIDVYRGEAKAQRNVFYFGTYVSLFPQLIAGPIVRYVDIEAQLEGRKENLKKFSKGIKLFIIGLSKKVLIANQMGLFWDKLQLTPGAAAAWFGMFAYTLQIYFDFSGYSDMALGLGRMFGFRFLRNFDYPYISKSITEFWRRWHISLGTWFREYVYIPLGGNRRGLPRQILNLMIVWMLTGLWHGASMNFVLWGIYYGVILILEKLFLLRLYEKIPDIFRRIIVILVVSFGWMLFYFTDSSELFGFISRLFTGRGTNAAGSVTILSFLPLMLLACFASTDLPHRLTESLKKSSTGALVRNLEFIGLAVLFVLCVAALVSQSYNPFIYFRF